MNGDSFDVVVIGGGIHGAGVAQAAAAAGYTVLLVEKRRLGSGTSSRSSKLIHGGLRYLESGQFSLVQESLRERALLLKNAPALVKPVSFFIPLYQDTSRGPWQVRLGLGLYAMLGGFGALNRFRSVPASRWPSLDGIRTTGLIKVFEYHDAVTDDQALTCAVAHSAQQLGAQVEESATFLDAAREKNGYIVRMRSGAGEREVRCAALINASGPWVNQVLNTIQPVVPVLAIDLVQGAHIVIRGRPRQGIYYTEAPSDGRAVFIMPWKDHGLVGTTETIFNGDPDSVVALDEEIAYLKATVAHTMPDMDSEVLDSFAGLRVLLRDQTTVFGRARETVLLTDDDARPRLVSIYGGKLTGYRATALKVMKLLEQTLPTGRPHIDTAGISLSDQ